MTALNSKKELAVPAEVSKVTSALRGAGFEAYLVGGCVRDLLLGRKPKDWDITTNAKPEEIIKTFPKTFYENVYGTVGVVNEESTDPTLKVVEVTPYRLEATYSDNRRPDSVTWSDKLEDDLKRRDFTVNAIAYDESKGQIIDLYKGQEDLKSKTLRTVGDPIERFNEDGLRILRAIRLHSDLGFAISLETEKAIELVSPILANISAERIRDEFVKILMSDNPLTGIFMTERLGVLKYVVPELQEGVHVKQNQAHAYDVWEHILRAVQCSADKKFPLEVRLAALFHDIGKPRSRRYSDEKGDWTFHGHEVIGEKMAVGIMKRLKFPNATIEKVAKLVRWHMFFSDTEQITLSAVRRMVANVGKENIWDLMNVRVCDRIGTGRPKESPYRLRKYHSMIEEAMRDPISVGMLKINGGRIIEIAKLAPGPKIGQIMHALLEEVLEDPKLNTAEYLEKRAVELANMSDEELKQLGEEAKKRKEEIEGKEIAEIRKKHGVK